MYSKLVIDRPENFIHLGAAVAVVIGCLGSGSCFKLTTKVGGLEKGSMDEQHLLYSCFYY